MSVNIKSSRLGVPYVIDEEEVIALTYAQADDLIAVEVMNPGVLDALNAQARKAVEDLTGIDADLPDVEWWTTFNALLAINEFTTPLHVIAQARAAVASYQEMESA